MTTEPPWAEQYNMRLERLAAKFKELHDQALHARIGDSQNPRPNDPEPNVWALLNNLMWGVANVGFSDLMREAHLTRVEMQEVAK